MGMNQTDRQRPYAAPANVLAVVHRCRRMNLPGRIDNAFLRLAGIPEGALGRVMAALRFLRLINEDGTPTDLLRSIAAAPEDEYRELWGGTLRTCYEADFERVNPAEDSQAAIVSHFQQYVPRSQINRMVMLFLGLCREAGIPVLDAPRERSMAPAARRRPRVVSGSTHTTKGRTAAEGTVQRTTTQPSGPSSPFDLLSEQDAAAMDEQEFKDVLDALGTAFWKIAQARARASKQAEAASTNGSEQEAGG
jgi:hypothetical protein